MLCIFPAVPPRPSQEIVESFILSGELRAPPFEPCRLLYPRKARGEALRPGGFHSHARGRKTFKSNEGRRGRAGRSRFKVPAVRPWLGWPRAGSNTAK